MTENGIESGARNVGRTFLWAIPLLLGLAASVWLGVWINAHGFIHMEATEKRAAQYVGAPEPPKSKIAFNVQNSSCVHVIRADVDGDQLLIYTQNDCHTRLRYVAIHWESISPDGTVIRAGYDNGIECAMPEQPGDKAECHPRFSVDERTATIRIWTKASEESQ